jgi:fumarate reductase flavoprotein subunit
MKQRNINRAALIVAQSVLIIALAGSCETSADSEESYTLHFTPGTYEASAFGYNTETPITVRVICSENAIENIEILSHGEGVIESVRDRFNAHEGQTLDEDMIHTKVQATLEHVPQAIVQDQTLTPDAISGATARWTREGILKAVEDCVRQAGGDEAVEKLKEGGTAKLITGYLG